MTELKGRVKKVIRDDRSETRRMLEPRMERLEGLWSNLVVQAYTDLTEVTFPLWMFCVGTSGSSEERLSRGYFHLARLTE